MDINVIYIGLDVDGTQYHGSGLNNDTVEFINVRVSVDARLPGCQSRVQI